jgi:hypothetical protein
MWTWRGLPHICATSDAIEALSNQRWYREVCTIKECPIAAQRHTELRTDRAVVPLKVDRGQTFVLQLPSLDPGLGQRQPLPCPVLPPRITTRPLLSTLAINRASWGLAP